jgi:hypothetical protein
MEQLGKLVHKLQSLHTWRCQDEEYKERGDNVSYGALSFTIFAHARMRGKSEILQAPLGMYPNEKPSNSEEQ